MSVWKKVYWTHHHDQDGRFQATTPERPKRGGGDTPPKRRNLTLKSISHKSTVGGGLMSSKCLSKQKMADWNFGRFEDLNWNTFNFTKRQLTPPHFKKPGIRHGRLKVLDEIRWWPLANPSQDQWHPGPNRNHNRFSKTRSAHAGRNTC